MISNTKIKQIGWKILKKEKSLLFKQKYSRFTIDVGSLKLEISKSISFKHKIFLKNLI